MERMKPLNALIAVVGLVGMLTMKRRLSVGEGFKKRPSGHFDKVRPYGCNSLCVYVNYNHIRIMILFNVRRHSDTEMTE